MDKKLAKIVKELIVPSIEIIMNKINLNIQTLNNAKGKPEYGSIEASGLDLKAGIESNNY